MSKRTAVIWSATWMSLTLFLSPIAIGSESATQSQALMTVSGLSDQLDALPNAVRSSFDQLLISDGVAEPFETDDVPQLKQAVASTFNAEALQRSILDEFDASLSDKDRAQLIHFYSTDTGAELRKAESDNSILKNTERFDVWNEAIGWQGVNPERQELIKALEISMQAAQGAVDAMIGMQIAMQVSLTPILPTAEQLSPLQLHTIAEQLRPELTELYYKSSLETLAFVFQDQSREALQAYSDILNTQAGQRYANAVNDGLSRGLFNSAEQLGLLLQDIVAARLGQGA